MHPTQAVEIFGNILWHLVAWPSVDIHIKFYGDRPRGTPPPGELNTRLVKYSGFGPIEGYTSETVQPCKIGGKLVLITNSKSYMSFRLVPKSVTLNDLGRRNGPALILRYFSPNSVAFAAHCVKVVDPPNRFAPQCTNVTDRTDSEDRQDNGPIAMGEPFYKRAPKKRMQGCKRNAPLYPYLK